MPIPPLNLSNMQLGSAPGFGSLTFTALDAPAKFGVDLTGVYILDNNKPLAAGAWSRPTAGTIQAPLWRLTLVVLPESLLPILGKFPVKYADISVTIDITVNFQSETITSKDIEITGLEEGPAKKALLEYLGLSVNSAIPVWQKSSAWATIRLLQSGHSEETHQLAAKELQELKATTQSALNNKKGSLFARAVRLVMGQVILYQIRRAEKQFKVSTKKTQALLLLPVPELDKDEVKILLKSPHKDVRLQAIKLVAEQKPKKQAHPPSI